jgi:hypothetical protein
MNTMKRYSPIAFNAPARSTEERDGWEVVIAYEGQEVGPVLVDLSHRSKWDLQDRDLDSRKPWGLNVPANPGDSSYKEGLLINRMNRTQASIWHLGRHPGPGDSTPAAEPGFTETTDAQAMLALVGEDLMSIMEKLTRLDLCASRSVPPVLVQGPVLDIPCQVVLLGEADGAAALLVAFSRGYGRSVADTFLEIGRDKDLRPGGEGIFSEWLDSYGG